MAQPEIAAILDRDFVIAQIDVDRMTGGKDIQKRYQPDVLRLASPGSRSSTPRASRWRPPTAPAATSATRRSPQEIDHFLAMVKGQGRRIDVTPARPDSASRSRRPPNGSRASRGINSHYQHSNRTLNRGFSHETRVAGLLH